MSMANKIKGAAVTNDVSHKELAARLGITAQALSNKYQRDSFSAGDLVRVADALGLQLAFVDQDGRQVVTFKPEDAAPPRRSGKTTEE